VSFLDEISARLVSQGVVGSAAIFVSSKALIPAGDGPFISLTETGGAGPVFVHNATTSPAQQRPSVQVLTRAKAYETAVTTARLAYNALTLHNTILSGTFYLSITPTQEPFDLGQDATGRAQVAFNCMTVRRTP
jgi:hypothetical protein